LSINIYPKLMTMTGEAALIAEGNRIKELRDDAKFLC
jgi:hypothetical protein